MFCSLTNKVMNNHRHTFGLHRTAYKLEQIFWTLFWTLYIIITMVSFSHQVSHRALTKFCSFLCYLSSFCLTTSTKLVLPSLRHLFPCTVSFSLFCILLRGGYHVKAVQASSVLSLIEYFITTKKTWFIGALKRIYTK